MPSSMVRRFADPDEYATVIRAAKVEFSITNPGYFAAKLVRIDLHRLWMQRYLETLPRVAHFENIPNRAFVSFATRAGPLLAWDGGEASTATIIRHSHQHSGFQRSTGSMQFASMSLPIAEMEALGATYGDSDFVPPRVARSFNPAPAAMRRLQRLHEAAGHLAEHAPEVIAEPEASRGLEQALIAALAECIRSADGHRVASQSNTHARIMKRFYQILEANPEGVLHMPEVCRALGVSNGTLTASCNEVLGMSPYRYLKLRQLNLSHRALALADPAATTVTEVATAHGFWDLGRFAGAYRSLFGERPSDTLRRIGGPATAASDAKKFLMA